MINKDCDRICGATGTEGTGSISSANKDTGTGQLILSAVLHSLGDDKAEDIVVIDLEGKSSIADHMVVASGRSQRHVGAIAEHLGRHMKEAGYGTARTEGFPNCDWVLVDVNDVIVHIFGLKCEVLQLREDVVGGPAGNGESRFVSALTSAAILWISAWGRGLIMRITIAAIGRSKRGPEQALFLDYVERLPWTVQLKEIDDRRLPKGPHRQAREADSLLGAVPTGAVVVALDETGRDLTSPAFAEKLELWQNEGRADVAFLIGGPDGLDDRVRSASALNLALGRMTWPHLLIRPMLAEQLYRAYTILTNHPYHRP